MEVEAKQKPFYRRKSCRICCATTTAVVLIIAIVILVLSLTEFKVKDPTITVTGMTMDGFSVNVDPTLTNLEVNVSMHLNVSAHNPNIASFKHSNSTTFIYYRGQEVGSFPVPAGNIGAKKTEKFETELEIQGWHIIIDANATAELHAGAIPINTYSSVRGTLNVINIFKHQAITTSNCSANILVANQTLGDFNCRNKIKL